MDNVLQLAMSLPPEDRLLLAETLLASLDPPGTAPFAPEWLAEAKRRAARIDAGEGRTLSWEEVRDHTVGSAPGPVL